MTEEQFNNLPVADKLRRINENIKDNKQNQKIDFDDLFPGVNGKSYG